MKNLKQFGKRALSVLLVLVMCVGMLFTNAFAADQLVIPGHEVEPQKLLTGESFRITVNQAYPDGTIFGSTTVVSNCTHGTGHSGYNHGMDPNDILRKSGYTGYSSWRVTRYSYWDSPASTTYCTYNITGSAPYKADQTFWVIYDQPPTGGTTTPGGGNQGGGNGGNTSIGSGRYSWTQKVVYHANYPDGTDPQYTKTYSISNYVQIYSTVPHTSYGTCGFVCPDGYSVSTWYDAASGGSHSGSTFSSTPTSGTLHFYAHYTADKVDPNTFALTYNANGGTVNGQASYTSTVQTSNTSQSFNSITPVRDGFEFLGWTATQSGGSYVSWPYTLTTSNPTATVYAQWSKLPDTHKDATVIYMPGTGTGNVNMESVPGSQPYGIKSVEDVNFTAPAGKVFSHWEHINSASGNDKYFPGDSITPADESTWIFVAIWKDDVAGTTDYTVQWINEEDNSLIKSETRKGTAGDPVSVTAADKNLSGYTFNPNNNGNLESAILAANGSTVLKLYFVKNPVQPKTVTITKTADRTEYYSGEDVTWKITVRNTGTETLEHLNLEDFGVDGVTVKCSDFRVKPNDFTLAPNTSKLFTVTLKNALPGTYVNHAVVKDTDGNPVSDETTADPVTVKVGYAVEWRWIVGGEILKATEGRPGNVGDQVSVTEADKADITKNGKRFTFVADEEHNVLDGTLSTDKATVLVLYFEQDYSQSDETQESISLYKSFRGVTPEQVPQDFAIEVYFDGVLKYTFTLDNAETLRESEKGDSYVEGTYFRWTIKIPAKGVTVTKVEKNWDIPGMVLNNNGRQVDADGNPYYVTTYTEYKDKWLDPGWMTGMTVGTSTITNSYTAETKALTSISKARLTTVPVGVTVGDDVNLDAKVSVDEGEGVKLLYAITVKGEEGANYTVTDANSVRVGGAELSGTIGESGEAVIYVVRTFTAAEVASGNASNTAFVKPGDKTDPVDPSDPDEGHPSDPENTPVEVVKPQPKTAHILVTKTRDSADKVKNGSVVNYTVTVTNDGEVDLHDLVIYDVMDAGLSMNSTVGTVGAPAVANNDGNNSVAYLGHWAGVNDKGGAATKHYWELPGTFKVGASVTLTYSATVSNTGKDEITLNNVAYAYGYQKAKTDSRTVSNRIADALSGLRLVSIMAEGDSAGNPPVYDETRDPVSGSAGTGVIGGGSGTSIIVTPDPEHSLTIKYVYEDGSEAAPDYTDTLTEGEDYSVNSPVIDGYTADKTVVSGAMGDEDIVVIVTYTKDTVVDPEPEKVTATWNDGYSENPVIKTEEINKGTVPGKDLYPENPTRDGYEFIGWSDPVVDEDGNVTITAQWKPVENPPVDPDPEKVTVTWNDGYSENPVIKTGEIDKGTVPGKDMYPEDPTRDGYEFIGWSDPVVDEDGNVTITAQWKPVENPPVDPEPEKVTVTWNDGYTDDPIKTGEVDKGTVPGKDLYPEDPTRDGYEFIGWSDPVINEDGSITITAQWKPVDPVAPPAPPVTPTNPVNPSNPSDPTDPADPTDPSDPEDPTDPGEDIGDPDTPLGPLPEDPALPQEPEDPTDPGEDINDPDTPMGELPGDPAEEISDPETPKSDAPQTGDNMMLWLAAGVVSGTGLIWMASERKREEDEEA